MRAALLHGGGDLRVEEVPDPSPAAGEVLIDVSHCGLCGSDLHMVHRPGPREAPVALGHEFAGVVRALGADTTEVDIGDVVCVQPNLPCGGCSACVAGLTHLCQANTCIGVNGPFGGGLSERIAVPADMVHRLPSGMSTEQGALVEPLAVGHNAVRRSGIESGQRALLVGAGPIGIATLLGLRAIGVDDVAVSESVPLRRRVMAEFGAEVFDPNEIDVPREIRRWSGGAGAAVAFDCAGASSAFDVAFASTAARGSVVVVGLHLSPTAIPFATLMMSEKRILGAYSYEDDVFPQVIDFMASGKYPTTSWVEHIALEAIVEEGIRPLERGDKLKVLVDLLSP